MHVPKNTIGKAVRHDLVFWHFSRHERPSKATFKDSQMYEDCWWSNKD
jgi:hypothetical protein